VKLEGTLDTFPLRELVEMIAYSSVTGVLNVYGPDSSGHLFFRDGQLYHADCGAQRGPDALVSMLEYERGQFAFVSDQTTGEETFWGGNDVHLHTAERLARRWRGVRAYVPTLALVPQLLIPREAALRRAGHSHLAMLEYTNGAASLYEIAAASGWGEIDVAEAFVQLALDGVVELRRAAAAPADVAGHEGRLFDRLLARAGASHPPRPAAGNDEAILRLLRG